MRWRYDGGEERSCGGEGGGGGAIRRVLFLGVYVCTLELAISHD